MMLKGSFDLEDMEKADSLLAGAYFITFMVSCLYLYKETY